jgi:hypothetical protein
MGQLDQAVNEDQVCFNLHPEKLLTGVDFLPASRIETLAVSVC